MTDLNKLKPRHKDVCGQLALDGSECEVKVKKKAKTDAAPGPVREMKRVVSRHMKFRGFVYVDDGSPVPEAEWPGG